MAFAGHRAKGRNAPYPFLGQDTQLGAAEDVPDAKVRPRRKGQVRGLLAVEVEQIGPFELRRIAAAEAEDVEQHLARAELRVADHLVLPVSALAFIYLALFLRVMRAGMAEAWKLDFVLLARAKGLSRSRIVLRHVARNALLPLVTMLGLQSAAMLGGNVVIESVFAIPGFGRLAQEAVNGRDAPLLMGIIVISAILVICVNFIVDLAYAALDPRIGASESGT